jgi:integrase
MEKGMVRKTTGTLHRLSVREVQTAGEGDHTDGGGLLLRVRGDNASWVFRFTAPSGRRREMGLGVTHRASAAQAGESVMAARKAARDARDKLHANVDPIDHRDQQRAEAQRREAETKAQKRSDHATLARVAREYHERVIETSKTPKHAAQWIASLEHHVPAEIWHSPIASIDAPDLLEGLLSIRSLADSKQRVPETLQRVRQRLDAVFEDAAFNGLCSTNPARAIVRKLREAQPRRKRGQFAALPFRDAPDLLARIRVAEGTAARGLELAVLTAARTGEVLGATWPEFDLDGGVWTVPAERMKAGEAHTVYLSSRAVEILRAQKQLGSAWAFASPLDPKEPLSNMAMLAVLGRLDVRDRTTVHGLCRATFSTWANETGAARPEVVEACLAHQETNLVRAAYNRAKFNDERKALMQAWCDYLAKPAAAKVLPIRAA